MRRLKQCEKLAVLAYFAFAFAFAGCGGGSEAPPPAPAIQNAVVTGQYDLVLTSSNGHGTINVYTNFTQTGAALVGAANTLVCLSNDLSKCEGDNAAVVTITPKGTVSGQNISLAISFPTTSGADTVAMVGTAAGTNLVGTYTDSLGDAGVWTASPGSPLTGTYNGTFNSTSNPLTITPAISFSLTQDANFNLTGTAIITNSPCISSLTFSGRAIGDAFTLTDAANKASIMALPNGSNFSFSYNFDPTAAHCAGDAGLGVVNNQSPWDY